MKTPETGLRHRLRRAERQIATQHAQLRNLHRSVAEAIAAARGHPVTDAERVQQVLDRLRGAIDAHFALEEGVFFPAIHGLDPASTPALTALALEHRDHLGVLDRLRDSLGSQPLAAFATAYRDFSDVTAQHEAREERLLASISHLFDGAG